MNIVEIKNLKKQRPSWQRYFMDIAKLVSLRSTCLRRQVGAVAVKFRHILVTGYNGAPAGQLHCIDIGCLRDAKSVPSGQNHELCRAIHAEQNLIIQASIHQVSLVRSTIYCTHKPCSICAKMLINAGVSTVIFENGYPDPATDNILEGKLFKLDHDSLEMA